MSRLGRGAAVAALSALWCTCSATSAPAAVPAYAPVDRPGPALSVPQASLDASLTCSGKVDGATREPVLLLPGTATTPRTDFSWNYEPALTRAGIPWCAVELPGSALQDIQVAGEYVVHGIRTLRARSGRRIGIIGHSQGGMIGRWALRWWPDTRPMVEDLVGNAPSNHGTIVAQAFKLACPVTGCSAAILQQVDGSAFMGALNSGQETFAGTDYTVNASRYDEIVVPYTTQALAGPARITNTVIQDICPGDLAEHLGIGTYDRTAWALALDALTHDGPADPSRLDKAAVCAQPLMPGVDPLSFVTDYADAGVALGAAIAGETGVRAEPPPACYVSAACPASAPTPATGSTVRGRCGSARRFVVRVDGGRGPRLRRVTRVTLDGRVLKVTRREGRLTAIVDLRRRTRGVSVLRITGKDAGGRTVTRVRRYQACRR
ncbi:MAG: putative lipase [Solirubrobacterales bacterium]|nr:putative lipase [Solirubrobacterales bacterium]